MASLNNGKIILQGIQVLRVRPRRNSPNTGKVSIAPAGEPRARAFVPISFARRGEKPRDRVIDLLYEGRIRLAEGDAVRRIAELKVVHGAGADGFAQAGSGNPARLVPRLINHSERIIPPAEAGGWRPKDPGIVREFQHKSQALREIDVPANVLFAPR